MNLTLILVSDIEYSETWIQEWGKAYPHRQLFECSHQQSIEQWQTLLNTGLQQCEEDVFIVASGIGAIAVAAWYRQINMVMQKRIKGIILASPKEHTASHISSYLDACRFTCKVALVLAKNDEYACIQWGEMHAKKWHARFFIEPQSTTSLVQSQHWEWGMKLMQEMLLD